MRDAIGGRGDTGNIIYKKADNAGSLYTFRAGVLVPSSWWWSWPRCCRWARGAPGGSARRFGIYGFTGSRLIFLSLLSDFLFFFSLLRGLGGLLGGRNWEHDEWLRCAVKILSAKIAKITAGTLALWPNERLLRESSLDRHYCFSIWNFIIIISFEPKFNLNSVPYTWQ